jgi:hypothetical protein
VLPNAGGSATGLSAHRTPTERAWPVIGLNVPGFCLFLGPSPKASATLWLHRWSAQKARRTPVTRISPNVIFMGRSSGRCGSHGGQIFAFRDQSGDVGSSHHRFPVGLAGGALLRVVGLTTLHYRYQEDDERDQRCRAEGHHDKSLFAARLKVGVVHYSQRPIAHPVRSAVLSHSPYLRVQSWRCQPLGYERRDFDLSGFSKLGCPVCVLGQAFIAAFCLNRMRFMTAPRL